jgi:hypothetical protein
MLSKKKEKDSRQSRVFRLIAKEEKKVTRHLKILVHNPKIRD